MSAKAKLFNPRLFFMDMARLVCACLPFVLRVKRLNPDGTKYRGRIKGPAIIAANHTSFLDPFIVGVTFWYRRLFFLVAEVVMTGKLRSWLLHGVGAIKIERSIADIEAVKKTVNVLRSGHLIAIFPQGGIVEENSVETAKSGSVLMALQAGAPIIPMYIFPRKHWYNRRKVVIGNAIHPQEYCQKKIPSTADIQKITDIMVAEMQRCYSGIAPEHEKENLYEHI